MKRLILILFILAITLILSGCITSNVKSADDVLKDQIGTLAWKGSPAVDGAGMLFIVGDTEYGAPGEPSDYTKYLNDEQLEVMIKADIVLTGEDTVRGWGATFPEIKFLKIMKVEAEAR